MQPYHPAAQDCFFTEAKQGWAGQYLDGRPPGKLLLEEVLVRLTLWSVWVLTPQYSDGDTILLKALSFGWDVKPRSWLSVVIKNPIMSFEKSRGGHSGQIPSIGLWSSCPPNHPHTLIGFITRSPLHQ